MVVPWLLKTIKSLVEITDGHKNISLSREGVPQLARRLSEKEYWKVLLECPALTRD